MQKRLYRSDKNRIFGGILGGLGEYLDIDPVLLRVIWVFVLVFTGFIPGILVYVIAYFIVPPHPPGPLMSNLQQEQALSDT